MRRQKETAFVIYHEPLGGYIVKDGGMNRGVRDPVDATIFSTREEAMDKRPGHSLSMGGAGLKGYVITLAYARSWYEAVRRARGRHYA